MMSTSNICATTGETQFRKSVGYCRWFTSSWFLTSLGGVVAMAVLTGLATSAPSGYVLGQIVLGLSVFISLSFLADRPLVNPIQGVVATFYWWFGVGPTVIATWNLLLGKPYAALDAQVSGMEALWIVAPGLILYAIVARGTLDWFSQKSVYARFLMPAGKNYRPIVLVAFISLAGFSTMALLALQWMGIHGREETSFFGGTKTTIWWMGVIAAIGAIAPFASSALMTALAAPWKTISGIYWILIGLVTGQTLIFALFGGWKSPIAVLGAYFVCAYVSRHQRPPWLITTAGALVFLLVITPFVSYGRSLATTSGAETSADRKQVFSEVLQNPEDFLSTEIGDLKISVFFRGIYPLAGELTRRNEYFNGEWCGETIAWGLDSLIPRVLNPGKRDLNIGNFFCQTVGADLGVSGRHDMYNNIAISIPFEFVGNYGIVAGLLSFGLIGVFWTLFTVWALSPARLSNHPLTPFFVLSTINIEQAMGHYLAGLRELIVPLIICFAIYMLLRGKM